jgi:hypothetical protein
VCASSSCSACQALCCPLPRVSARARVYACVYVCQCLCGARAVTGVLSAVAPRSRARVYTFSEEEAERDDE